METDVSRLLHSSEETLDRERLPASETAAARRMQGSHRVSVVIPCSEGPSQLRMVLAEMPTWVDEVILAEDGCDDAVYEIAVELMPEIHTVSNDLGPGRANALLSAAKVARGDFIVQLEPDGSTHPAEIHGPVGMLLAGADLAYADAGLVAFRRRWAPVLLEGAADGQSVEALMRARAAASDLVAVRVRRMRAPSPGTVGAIRAAVGTVRARAAALRADEPPAPWPDGR
jgi:hypothetical protein